MPKSPKGRGKISPDSRRNGARIAISPSAIAKVDAIALYEEKSRADVLEELIDKEFKAFALTADENQLEKAGMIK